MRSKFEEKVAKQLRAYRAKPQYEAEKIPYTISYNYVPDFLILRKDGTKLYIEAKGLGRAFDDAARRKMEAVKEQNPDLDIRIVFMSNRPYRKRGKKRPSDWAEKHKFPYSIGTVPKEWL